jgi:nitrogen regulatory protein PII
VNAAIIAGAPAATIYYARGTGIREKLGFLKIFITPEKEVIEIVVPKEQADEILNTMVDAGELDVPGMGFIYTIPVKRALLPRSVSKVTSENDPYVMKYDPKDHIKH